MSKYVPCGVGKKSTLLLLLIIFCLFNTALLFRAAVNTLYFMEDPGKDYSAITGIVTELVPAKESIDGKPERVTPVFSFTYQGETMTREAPVLQFAPQESDGAYQINDKVSLWIHNHQGEIILPPDFSRKRVGMSQLVVSALSLLLAIILWKVRNLLAKRKQQSCSLQ